MRSKLAAVAFTLGAAVLATLGNTSTVKATSPVYGAIAVAAADNQFGLALLRAVTAKHHANVVLSPVSAGLDLAMVYNGARGATAKEMAATLELKDAPIQGVNAANTELMRTLRAHVDKVQLEVANTLFTDKRRLALVPAFATRVAKAYDAEVSDLDFSDHASVEKVNGWVDKLTHGKIQKVIDRISATDLLFLINAVYFKGEWAVKFDKTQTTQKDFKLADGSAKKVWMMAQTGKYSYLETPEFQAVQLPYGKGDLRMLIFLPSASSSLEKFVQSVDYQKNFSQWLDQFTEHDGHIEVPRFEIHYSVLLNSPLGDLGMKKAFDARQADFGAMFELSKGKLNPYIGFVKQDTYLRVDEEGSEAAAATTTGMRVTAIRVGPPPFEMIVDRPFFCAIGDKRTGALLFVGTIYKP